MLKNSQNSISQIEAQLLDCLPGISIDCVILGYRNQELHILLLQWKHEKTWSLPGGFIHQDEDMDEAARRILSERTNLDSIFLNQFHTFGNKSRSKGAGETQTKRTKQFLKEFQGKNQNIIEWFGKRFLTTGYFALVDVERTNPQPDFLSEKCEWKSIKAMPPLIMDHKAIVLKALEQLRIQLNYLPVGLSLLPKKFTMQDLQKLYEAILQKPLERSNFQRKMLKLEFLNRHEKQMTGAANKAPYLYSFDKKRYNLLLKKGIGFSF